MRGRFQSIVAAPVAALLLAACGGESEAVGYWQSTNEQRVHDVLKIDKSGQSYSVTSYHKSLFDGRLERKDRPATFADGVLMIASDDGSVPVLYVSDADEIVLDGRWRYRRSSPSMLKAVQLQLDEETAARETFMEERRQQAQ